MIKTPEQIEFADLVTEMGWRPVEVAKSLGMTKGAISYILSGKRNPSPGTLAHLRKINEDLKKARAKIDDENGRAVGIPPDRINEKDRKDLFGKLEDIAEADPRSLESVKVLVDALHQRVSTAETIQGVSPEIAKIARNAAPGALALALREDRARRQKRKVASTSESKPSQAHGAGQHPKPRPGFPTRAPGERE